MGSYLTPTLLDGLTKPSAICQEEIFGPVLVALPFDDEADLVAQANDSVYALAACIWTADYKRAWRDSGLGREKGTQGILQCMQQKSVYWGLNEAPLPWSS